MLKAQKGGQLMNGVLRLWMSLVAVLMCMIGVVVSPPSIRVEAAQLSASGASPQLAITPSQGPAGTVVIASLTPVCDGVGGGMPFPDGSSAGTPTNVRSTPERADVAAGSSCFSGAALSSPPPCGAFGALSPSLLTLRRS